MASRFIIVWQLHSRQAMEHRSYIAIDLKSFYASVECMDRGLNPLTTNLVVADASRTEKTICLAVSPSLKAYGIPGRPRLFEVVQRVKAVNRGRMRQALGGVFSGTSSDDMAVKASPDLALGYITATPRMGLYMEYSTRIYQLYLKYVAPEDIHIYSIDEVFIDVTAYLQTYGLSPQELAVKIIQDVLSETGITATVGMGSNLYLCKIAMVLGQAGADTMAELHAAHMALCQSILEGRPDQGLAAIDRHYDIVDRMMQGLDA